MAYYESQACINNSSTLQVRTTHDVYTDLNDPIYFGLGLTEGTQAGNYTGQSTFAFTAADTTCD
jgi:hypothetical protein